MNCLNCGKELREEAKFCMDCGQKVPRCPTCGTVLLKRAKFCILDGTPIPEEINALFPQEVPAPMPARTEKASPAATPKADVPAAEVYAPAEPAPAEPETPAPVPPDSGAVPQRPRRSHQASAEPISIFIPDENPTAPPAKKKSDSKLPIIAILAVVILAVGLVAGRALFTPGAKETGGPDVTELSAAASVPMETDADRENTQPPETQAPQILMPDCVGWHYDDTVQSFASLPCRVSFTYAYSDTVEENHILEQNLPEGSELTADTEVVFTVSKGPDVAPEGYNQKLTVVAAPGSSYATLTLYDWENGQWVAKFSCNATVGIYGISPDYGEGRKRTPQGVFKLGVALTASDLSDVDWPVHYATSNTCVIDDVNSPDYNTICTVQDVPYGTSYDRIGRLLASGSSTICLYIEHNGNGYDTENVVPGKGSVITICGRVPAIEPTPGCVDISASNMSTLISMLSYDKNTHIEIYTE